jgi:cytochrome c5
LRHQDEQFFDSFMLVIGILIGVAVGLFFLVRMISVGTQDVFVREDPAVMAAIDERIRPIGRVVLLGDEELAAAPAIIAAPTPAATQMTGPQVYNAACTICHGTGVGGAPVTGDGPAWVARLEQGMELMVRHAIDGFTGADGYMPPKGGRVDLSDEEVTLAVEYMVEQL